MKRTFLFAVAIICFSAQLALADDGQLKQQWNKHQGYYAEVNMGTNLYYLGAFSSAGEASTGGFQGFGWCAAGGYNFTATHAIEGGFMQNYLTFEDDDGEAEADSHTNIYYIAWRGTVPIKERFSFFGKVGAMAITVPEVEVKTKGTEEDVDTSDNFLVLPFTGLGVSYAITPKIDFTVQYQGAVYLIIGAGALTGGITYHF